MGKWRQSRWNQDEASPAVAAAATAASWASGCCQVPGTALSSLYLLLALPAESLRAGLHQPCFTDEVVEAWERLRNWLQNRVRAAGSSPGPLPPLQPSPRCAALSRHSGRTAVVLWPRTHLQDQSCTHGRRPLKYKVLMSPSAFKYTDFDTELHDS